MNDDERRVERHHKALVYALATIADELRRFNDREELPPQRYIINTHGEPI